MKYLTLRQFCCCEGLSAEVDVLIRNVVKKVLLKQVNTHIFSD